MASKHISEQVHKINNIIFCIKKRKSFINCRNDGYGSDNPKNYKLIFRLWKTFTSDWCKKITQKVAIEDQQVNASVQMVDLGVWLKPGSTYGLNLLVFR